MEAAARDAPVSRRQWVRNYTQAARATHACLCLTCVYLYVYVCVRGYMDGGPEGVGVERSNMQGCLFV
jgi:hypothetical protein